MYEQTDSDKLQGSIRIPIETNYGKDFTFRTNKQGFIESPLPHFYHGVGHPSSDFNFENLEFNRYHIRESRNKNIDNKIILDFIESINTYDTKLYKEFS